MSYALIGSLIVRVHALIESKSSCHSGGGECNFFKILPNVGVKVYYTSDTIMQRRIQKYFAVQKMLHEHCVAPAVYGEVFFYKDRAFYFTEALEKIDEPIREEIDKKYEILNELAEDIKTKDDNYAYIELEDELYSPSGGKDYSYEDIKQYLDLMVEEGLITQIGDCGARNFGLDKRGNIRLLDIGCVFRRYLGMFEDENETEYEHLLN